MAADTTSAFNRKIHRHNCFFAAFRDFCDLIIAFPAAFAILHDP
jgi:hypothetical protein